MADDFDPYQKWLGIPPQEQPPNFYRLLTLKPLESDLDVISKATTNLTAYLAARSKGKNAPHAIRLLDEVIAAGTCLLDPTCKAVYDAALQTAGAQAAADAVAKRPAATRQVTEPAIAAAILIDMTPAASKPLVDMSFLEGLAGSSSRPTLGAKAKAAVRESDPRKRPQKWQPKLWQGAAAAGAVLLVIIVAFVIAGQSKSRDERPPNAASQEEPRFGNQTVDLIKLQAEQEAKRRIPRNLSSFAVPIRRVGDFFLTAVTINGQPSGDFLLDTGAEATAVSPALAAKLKLPDGDRPARVRAVGGGQTATFRKTQTLHIGEVRFDNLQLVAIDLKAWQEATGAKFDGVIGCDIWGELMFCIDPELEKLTFYDRDRMPRGDTSGEFLTEIEHRPFVTVRLDGGEEVQCLAATGCGHELMLRTTGEAPDRAGQGGGSAATDGSPQKIVKLTLFGQTFENLSQFPARWDDVYILKSDPRQAGVVGGHVLANFKLVMDLQRHKVIAQRVGSKDRK